MNPNAVAGLSSQNTNKVPAIWYTDIGIVYNMRTFGHDEQLYFAVNNLFNRSPPIDLISPTSFSSPTNGVYDRDGRYFSIGVRFRN